MTVEFYVRATLYALFGTATFAVGSMVIAPLSFVVGSPEKANRAVLFLLGEVVAPLCGVSYEIEGAEHLSPELCRGRRVVVANHQAALDILALGKVFPKRTFILAKHTLAYAPFLGWFLTLARHFFVKRRDHGPGEKTGESHESAIRTMKDIIDRIKSEDVGIMIFPEGTRAHSPSPQLLPFKKGAFIIAVETEAPIVPIVIANYSFMYDTRARVFKPGTVRIRVLEPIETKGMGKADVERLMVETRERMQKVYTEISAGKAKL